MGLSSNASNVLLAKCRARFGKRLTMQDVNTLVGCHTVSEVASYLKANTHYGQALENTDTTAIHRRELESTLRSYLFEDLSSLCRYELSVGEWFSDYILMRGEIQQIISYLRLFSAGRQNEFIFSLPAFYMQHLDLDIQALASAKTYKDFLSAMRRSRFIKVLRTFTPDSGEPVDIAMIEHALYRQFYENIDGIISRHYSGSALDELRDIMSTQQDILNFCHLYRMKKYYHAEPASIRAWMLGSGSNIRSGKMNAMIEAPGADKALELFMSTSYGRLTDLGKLENGGIEAATSPVIFSKALRYLRSSVNPTTVMLSFINIAETELQDVVSFIEGVHYGLAPGSILNMTTIDNFYD